MHHLSGGNHPHIVKLVDKYEDERHVMLVMELCTGEATGRGLPVLHCLHLQHLFAACTCSLGLLPSVLA